MKKVVQILLLTFLIVIVFTIPVLGQSNSYEENVSDFSPFDSAFFEIGISPFNLLFFEREEDYRGYTYSLGFFINNLYYPNKNLGVGLRMDFYIDLPKSDRPRFSVFFAFLLETKIPISETLHIIPFKLAIGFKNIFGVGFIVGSGIKIYFNNKFALTISPYFIMGLLWNFSDNSNKEIGFGLAIGFSVYFL